MDARVAILGPSPLITVTVESRGTDGDDVHMHAGGQGVWVARMAGELGAWPVLCGFIGGETGTVLESLLDGLPGERRLIATSEPSGCYVVDRRQRKARGHRGRLRARPSRHEVDDLVSATSPRRSRATCSWSATRIRASSSRSRSTPTSSTDVRDNGTPVLVDLSTPRWTARSAAGPTSSS